MNEPQLESKLNTNSDLQKPFWTSYGTGRFVDSKPDPNFGSSFWCFVADKQKSHDHGRIQKLPKFGDRPMHQTSGDFSLGNLTQREWMTEQRSGFRVYDGKDLTINSARIPKAKSFLDTLDGVVRTNLDFDWPGPYPRFRRSLWNRIGQADNQLSSYRDQYYPKQAKCYEENHRIRKQRQQLTIRGMAGNKLLKQDYLDFNLENPRPNLQHYLIHTTAHKRSNEKPVYMDYSSIYAKIPSKQHHENFHRISGDLKLALHRLGV